MTKYGIILAKTKCKTEKFNEILSRLYEDNQKDISQMKYLEFNSKKTYNEIKNAIQKSIC